MYFIAEIGINHNGDINIAKEMIKMAKEVGADCVKFQKRTPELCVPELQKNTLRETPWGEMTYLEYKKRIEFEKEEYDEIDRYCKEIGIHWTASVWDIPSVEFIAKYNVPFIKVPSACITDIALLKEVKKVFGAVAISTGMSTKEEILAAIQCLDKSLLMLMHCNSSYPSKDNELDLLLINKLKEISNNWPLVGYSGHEEGYIPTIVAVSLGAKCVERHITLDKNMWGTDQKCSLDRKELEFLIPELKKIKTYLGQGNVFHVYESEKQIREKLRKV